MGRATGTRLIVSSLRRIFVMPSHKLMQGEWDLVGMRSTPCNNSLEFESVIRDGADLNQLSINDLWISHKNLALHTSSPCGRFVG